MQAASKATGECFSRLLACSLCLCACLLYLPTPRHLTTHSILHHPIRRATESVCVFFLSATAAAAVCRPAIALASALTYASPHTRHDTKPHNCLRQAPTVNLSITCAQLSSEPNSHKHTYPLHQTRRRHWAARVKERSRGGRSSQRLLKGAIHLPSSSPSPPSTTTRRHTSSSTCSTHLRRRHHGQHPLLPVFQRSAEDHPGNPVWSFLPRGNQEHERLPHRIPRDHGRATQQAA